MPSTETPSFRRFTAGEAVAAEALAKVIVPSDEDTPGLEDVDVFGPAAIALLDKLVCHVLGPPSLVCPWPAGL
jgi:hypothetical protein